MPVVRPRPKANPHRCQPKPQRPARRFKANSDKGPAPTVSRGPFERVCLVSSNTRPICSRAWRAWCEGSYRQERRLLARRGLRCAITLHSVRPHAPVDDHVSEGPDGARRPLISMNGISSTAAEITRIPYGPTRDIRPLRGSPSESGTTVVPAPLSRGRARVAGVGPGSHRDTHLW